jgi:FkbM family methyltransferase
MKPIIISIGAFTPLQAFDSAKAGHHVIAYEPRRDTCEEYSKIQIPGFEWYQCAVSGKVGKTILYQHEGASTILPMTNCSFKIDEEYEVDVVAMSDILSAHLGVHRMSLNCEGSEISILMETPIELLARCKNIDVEFHQCCTHLNITDEDVQKCVSKMRQRFICKIVDPTQPYMTFKRK